MFRGGEVGLILALRRACDFTDRASQRGPSGGVGAELVEFSLAVPGILFGGATRDLTDLAVQFDRVFEFEMRLGLLVGLQVLLTLALVFAQRTKKGLASTPVVQAVPDLVLVGEGFLRRGECPFAVADTSSLHDAKPTRARRVCDVGQSRRGVPPLERVSATRRKVGVVRSAGREPRVRHAVVEMGLSGEALFGCPVRNEQEVGDGHGGEEGGILGLPPDQAILVGQGTYPVGGGGVEAVCVHCLTDTYYFRFLCK